MATSFFIGRFQPLHKGHISIIQKLLDEGNQVVVGIRDTQKSKKNPFSLDDRMKMFYSSFNDARVKVVVIPDIDEIVFGRKVGYKIRRVRLTKQLEEISGTQVRVERRRIYWLTGNVGAGKTSLAYLLKERLGAIVLDGDEMRKSISLGAGFDKQERRTHNLRVARLAKVLSDQDQNIVVSVIAPFEEVRQEIVNLCNPYWIYIKGGEVADDKPYEPPSNPDLIIDPDNESLTVSLERIMTFIMKKNLNK